MLATIDEGYFVLNWLYKICRVACSENYINIKLIKHYFSEYILEKRQDNYKPIVTFISQIFLFVEDTIFDSFRESGNLLDEIASLTQEVNYPKINPLFFKFFSIVISPAVALFKSNPSVISLTKYTLTG